ncbi:MAG: alpha/beta hydrolase fold domain-containing protein [Acidimicrobiales bacterium]|nr:alpha/beta hydrolase fold domain-containing protein [Acidimicrobiales bacterium]
MDLVIDGVAIDAAALIGELSDDTLAAARAQMAAAGAAIALSDAVARTDHEIPGGPVVRVHRPVDATGPLPGVLWLHGGGLVMGDRFQDDARFDRWCVRHQLVAVTVDYRLAPEAPYPAALEDGHGALTWMRDHADAIGLDPRRLGIGGDSAGGGLAAAVALLARDQRTVALAFQVLIYPMLDDRGVTRSSRRSVAVWPPEANAYGWRSYLGERVGAPDLEAYAAPARAEDVAGLPPTYVVVGTGDGFVDEDVEFARRLIDAGVPVDLRLHAGLPHGFDVLAPRAPATRQAMRDLHDWLGRQVTGVGVTPRP